MGSAADDELLAAATVAKSSRQMLAVGDLVKVTDGDPTPTLTLTPNPDPNPNPNLSPYPNPNPHQVHAMLAPGRAAPSARWRQRFEHRGVLLQQRYRCAQRECGGHQLLELKVR